jgi:hypothetical protein
MRAFPSGAANRTSAVSGSTVLAQADSIAVKSTTNHMEPRLFIFGF